MRRESESAGDVSVERSIVVATAPAIVWGHLTDGDLVSRWMDGEVTIEPKPGGHIRMRRDGAEDVWGTIEEVVVERRLQWCWRTDDGLPTLVEIEIEQTNDGTVLTVRETLLPWQVLEVPQHWTEPPAPQLSMHTRAA